MCCSLTTQTSSWVSCCYWQYTPVFELLSHPSLLVSLSAHFLFLYFLSSLFVIPLFVFPFSSSLFQLILVSRLSWTAQLERETHSLVLHIGEHTHSHTRTQWYQPILCTLLVVLYVEFNVCCCYRLPALLKSSLWYNCISQCTCMLVDSGLPGGDI